jgi:hypothetical protein
VVWRGAAQAESVPGGEQGRDDGLAAAVEEVAAVGLLDAEALDEVGHDEATGDDLGDMSSSHKKTGN